MNEYPQVIGNGLETLLNWARRVTQERIDDVNDYYALSNKADGYLSFERVTTDYNVGKKRVILADTSAGNMTVTIPNPEEVAGKFFYIKKIENSHNVTVEADGGANIDGSASVTLSAAHESLTLFSDGTEYWII